MYNERLTCNELCFQYLINNNLKHKLYNPDVKCYNTMKGLKCMAENIIIMINYLCECILIRNLNYLKEVQ